VYSVQLFVRTPLSKIPTLKEYGIDKAVFDKNINKMAKDAFASGSPSNTRKQITAEDMEMLYKEMWKG
jgi:alcohol dehydrogenase class IV